jgi:hypothetical protein
MNLDHIDRVIPVDNETGKAIPFRMTQSITIGRIGKPERLLPEIDRLLK